MIFNYGHVSVINMDRLTFNQRVDGSIPSGLTRCTSGLEGVLLF